MNHRGVPWSLDQVCFCIYGHHGAVGPVARALREEGIAVACIASQRADSHDRDPVEMELARQGLFDDPCESAVDLGIPLLHLPDPNREQSIERLRGQGTNVILSISAPIFKPAFLDAFDGWVFNLHGSKVYRGRAGLSWNILNGLQSDSVVLHWIDAGIDTGAVVDEEEYRWGRTDYPIDLFRAQIPCFENLVRRFARCFEMRLIPRALPSRDRPYLPALSTDLDGWIDWRWDTEQVVRATRAFGPPYGGASASLELADRSSTRTVRIGRCEVDPGVSHHLHAVAAGAILAASAEGGVVVACKAGGVRILSFLEEGREVAAGEIARLGMRLRGRT